MCCSLGDDPEVALVALAGHAPEHIIVEASGISDPWRIAQTALLVPGHDLQPLVVMVDAAAILGQLADPRIAETIERQLGYAELVALNKVRPRGGPGCGARAAIAARRPEAR